MFYYIIIEEARRQRLGLDREILPHRAGQPAGLIQRRGRAENPYAQFPGQLSPEAILGAEP